MVAATNRDLCQIGNWREKIIYFVLVLFGTLDIIQNMKGNKMNNEELKCGDVFVSSWGGPASFTKVKRMSNSGQTVAVARIRRGDIVKMSSGQWMTVEDVQLSTTKGWRVITLRSGKKGTGKKTCRREQVSSSVKRMEREPQYRMVHYAAYTRGGNVCRPELGDVPAKVYRFHSRYTFSKKDILQTSASHLRGGEVGRWITDAMKMGDNPPEKR